ncbi:MAG: hypothetical protein MUC66_09090 [Methanolinea sp.]|jgi:hypothetical protein|nr:hypothetical protein [Methanolinea sp.]
MRNEEVPDAKVFYWKIFEKASEARTPVFPGRGATAPGDRRLLQGRWAADHGREKLIRPDSQTNFYRSLDATEQHTGDGSPLEGEIGAAV